jgi:hypothetical protein
VFSFSLVSDAILERVHSFPYIMATINYDYDLLLLLSADVRSRVFFYSPSSTKFAHTTTIKKKLFIAENRRYCSARGGMIRSSPSDFPPLRCSDTRHQVGTTQ